MLSTPAFARPTSRTTRPVSASSATTRPSPQPENSSPPAGEKARLNACPACGAACHFSSPATRSHSRTLPSCPAPAAPLPPPPPRPPRPPRAPPPRRARPLAVGRQRHARARPLVPLQRPKLLARLQVPHPHHPVRPARDGPLAVPRQGDVPDGRRVPDQ